MLDGLAVVFASGFTNLHLIQEQKIQDSSRSVAEGSVKKQTSKTSSRKKTGCDFLLFLALLLAWPRPE